jgi:hypothetical protein
VQQPGDRAHELLGPFVTGTRVGSADHAMVRVVVEQAESDLVQRGLDR